MMFKISTALIMLKWLGDFLNMYSNEDVHDGNIYVREKGKLCIVNIVNDTGHSTSIRKTTRLFEKDFSVRLCIDNATSSSTRKDHFVFTYNSEGSLRYTAKSLFDICLHYIADNVQHIDSLVGFPEQMADRLFSAAEEKQKFSSSETLRALQVFCEAYGDLVLKSLCLRNRFFLLSEKMEEIKTFRSLQSLDLHGCKLGDNHEIFEHLTSDQLSRSLSRLFLGGNCLSDPGLQKLTAPVRVMKRGLQNLTLLDLSYNPISEMALGYLACFQKLQGLELSRTHIKPGNPLNRLMWCKMGLVVSDTPLKEFQHSCCKTEGWAQEVINQWDVNGAKLLTKDMKPRTNALRFYGREKFVRDTLKLASVVHNKQDDSISRLQFYRPTLQVDDTGNTDCKMDSPAQKGIKRKLSAEKEKTVSSTSSKRQCMSSLSAEDLDLLNSY